LIEFGVPSALATPLGSLLPVVELVVAVALLSSAYAWWAAVGALVLLLVFIAAISVNLARGQKPICRCFGRADRSPVGLSTLIRNEMLAAVAGLIVWQGWNHASPDALTWVSNLAPSQRIILLIALIVLGMLAINGGLLKHVLGWDLALTRPRPLVRTLTNFGNAEALPPPAVFSVAPVAGLPIHAPAPTFDLPALDAQRVTLDALRATRKPVMLIFWDPACGPCELLLPDISRWQREYAATFTIALLSRGTREDNHTKSVEHRLTNIVLQHDNEIVQAYRVAGLPTAVIVQPNGTIGSRLALGADAIRALVTSKVAW
jgi:thiol-disulfide isomerase/thioredoxin